MEKEQLLEKYRRFKQWQEKPFEYGPSSEELHHCNNCGNDFKGNYCPICSQKAGVGRVGWSSVRQGIMDIWGLGTRSLLYSIWQLLWRPGHLISDYIDGKRQVSFPPVKMLFIVALIYSMVVYWILPQFFSVEVGEYNGKNTLLFGEELSLWMRKNYSWISLMFAVMSILPTWLMFRYAPRHTRHTLPEGFFIQVFLSVLMMVLSFFAIPLGGFNSQYVNFINAVLFGVYYLITYKQLFGYSFWGTLWRSGFVMFFILFFSWGVLFCFIDMNKNSAMRDIFTDNPIGSMGLRPELMRFIIGGISMVISFITFVVGYVINFIASYRVRKTR